MEDISVKDTSTWQGWASDWLSYGAKKANQFYTQASKPGEIQQKVQAVGRTVIGLASISTHPLAAVGGAIAVSIAPSYAKVAVGYVDSMIASVWNKMSFDAKACVTVIGTGALYLGIGTSLTAPLVAVFAANVGAEYCLKNYRREKIAAEIKQLTHTNHLRHKRAQTQL